MKDFRARLLAAFQVEHKDHLEAVRAMLDQLEEAGWSPASIDAVELHRRIHSLKGAARAVDLRHIEALAHRLETVIDRHHRGERSIDAGIAHVLRSALDSIEDTAAAVDRGGSGELPANILADVDTVAGQTARTAGPDPGKLASAEIPPATAETTAPVDGGAAAAPALPRNLRIDTDSLDGLFECSSDVASATESQFQLGDNLDILEQELRSIRQALDTLRRTDGNAPDGRRRHSSGTRSDAPRFRDLDLRLHRLETRLRGFSNAQRASGVRLRQLGRTLEEHVRRVRMIPAEAVFGGMRKMVRDLAAEHGKSVRVDFRGLDTLTDRAILQNLSDPVMHVLRNAIGHGIETPEERVAAGKAREGRVLLEIGAAGGRLVLKVEDDGRGIDLDRVRELASKLRMPADAVATDSAQLTALLSAPGLSTSDVVTELAGRGIGLSVVATTVARLQGEFSIQPGPAGGAIVTMSMPISISSRRLVVVQCDGQSLCIPAHGVARLHRLPRDRVETIDGRPVARIDDGTLLRLVPLAALTGIDTTAALLASPDSAHLLVVALRHAGARIGAVVDSLTAVHDGVVRELQVAAGIRGPVSGAVVAADGTVLPVLDVPTLVAAARTAGTIPLVGAAKPERPRPRSILVVDDSITTRTLEKSILEASGYEVRLSVDGLEALEELRARPADLVISDIEMPRLDGFGLLQALKRDRALATIPVILVTSRNNDADRRRGLSLGADAYVVKQRFDQNDLLTTIGQLL